MAKKPRIEVAAAGTAPVMKHNPFGALAGATAPAAAVAPAARPPKEEKKVPAGRLVLRREKKHRGGKTVVIIAGFETRPELNEKAIHALAKQLKNELGCGGTVDVEGRKYEIVIQGDQPTRVAEFLRAQGFRVDGVT